MRGRTIRRFGTYLLLVQLFVLPVFPCHAAQIGQGASVASDAEPPLVTSVTISPGTTVIAKDAKCSFTAYVAGVNDYSREVVWSVSGQTSQSTFIDANGVLNVAADEKAASLVVKAVSRQDSNYSATALVSVQAGTYYLQVKASPDNGGDVYGSGSVREGGSAVISATAREGFTFDAWTLNGNQVSRNAQYTVENMRGDATYVAEFKPISCRITVNVSDSNAGTATESRDVNYGESIALEAWAKEGYQFDCWMEGGKTVSRDSRMQLDRITGARTFTAVFLKKEEQPKTYTITATTSSGNGTIAPAGKSTVREGEGLLYTITPKSGYAVSTVYVDGKSVGWMTSFNFTDVRENHTISVDFAEAPAKDKNSAAAEKPAQTDSKTEQKTDAADKDKTAGKDKKEDEDKEDDADKDEGEEAREDSGDRAQGSTLTGTLGHLQISVEEAERLIAGSNDAALMSGALETGDLRLTIHNDFADKRKETSTAGSYRDTSVPNFDVVMDYLLDGEEKMEMLQGNAPVVIDLYVEKADGKETVQMQKSFEEKKLPGMRIGQCFETSLTVARKNETKPVSKLPSALQVVLRVPEHLKAENRRFYVLQLHTPEDGGQELIQLADEDADPDTITFSTDTFSPCAIGYIGGDAQSGEASEQAGEGKNSGLKNAAGMIVVLLAAAATVTGVIYIVGKKRR